MEIFSWIEPSVIRPMPNPTRDSETSVELLVQAGRGAAKPQQDPIAVNRGLSTLKSPLVALQLLSLSWVHDGVGVGSGEQGYLSCVLVSR